jgi:multidrug efflux pump subunit AcrA (membrane-fusion protein)
VVATPEGADVYTVRDGNAVLAHARLGPLEGELVPVLGGLAEGEPVVVTGQAELRDGMAVVMVSP